MEISLQLQVNINVRIKTEKFRSVVDNPVRFHHPLLFVIFKIEFPRFKIM